jgi:hypothetical protein
MLESMHLFFILVSFTLGAALSGVIINNALLNLGHNYSFALLLERVLLFFTIILSENNSNTGHFLASAACGL